MQLLFRPLTPPEATFAYMHQLLDGTSQVATLVTLPFLVDELRARAAVSELAGLFWCLSVKIVARSDHLWFYPTDDIPQLETCVVPVNGRFSPDEALRDELRDVLPAGGPLWRLRAVFDPNEKRTHFLFSRNHAISDGYTSAMILSTLVELLEQGTRSLAEMPLSLSAWQSLSDGNRGAPAAKPSLALADYDFPEPAQLSQRGPGLMSLKLPSKAVPVVRTAGRDNGCSINDLFAAALVRGFCRATVNDEMVLYTAASLRNRGAGSPVKSTGCFITVIPNVMDAGRDGLLHLARRCRSALRAGLRAWQPPNNDHRAIKAAVERMSGVSTYPGIALTNVGALPSRAKALLRACDYRTVVNRKAGNYGIVLHLSTLGDDFSASLAYPCGLLPDDIVAKVKSHIEDDIAALHSLQSTIEKQIASIGAR